MHAIGLKIFYSKHKYITAGQSCSSLKIDTTLPSLEKT